LWAEEPKGGKIKEKVEGTKIKQVNKQLKIDTPKT
jgi:hypothetical protein